MAKKNQEDVFRTGLELPSPSEALTQATEEAQNLLETRKDLAKLGVLPAIVQIAQNESFDELVQNIMRQNIAEFQKELTTGAQINTLQLAKALAIAL